MAKSFCIPRTHCDVFQEVREKRCSREVPTLRQKPGMPLYPKKIRFLKVKIDYLGHVIRSRRIEIALQTTDAIRKWKDPLSVTELRSFLELCRVSKRFVPNFVQKAAFLNWKLQKVSVNKIWIFQRWRTERSDNPSAEVDLITCSSATVCWKALHCIHRRRRLTLWLYTISGATQQDWETDWLSFEITFEGREDI